MEDLLRVGAKEHGNPAQQTGGQRVDPLPVVGTNDACQRFVAPASDLRQLEEGDPASAPRAGSHPIQRLPRLDQVGSRGVDLAEARPGHFLESAGV